MNDDRRDVRLEIRIDAAPETVFVLLTDPTQMQSWFAEQVEADPRPGGIFRISGPIGVSIEGTYLEVVPNRKVVFTWAALKGSSPGSRQSSSCLSRMAMERWSGCATMDCLDPRSNRIAPAGSIPDWPSSRMQPKGVGRPASA